MVFLKDGGTHGILGPEAAAGAVIWSHGRSTDSEDSLAPTPPYIEAFRVRGWDAFRFDRTRAGDSLRTGSRALALLAASLKAQGYRNVVLAGQSFGAFMSLMAAGSSNDVDAVIAVAPAAFGPVTENPAWGALNALRLYPLLEQTRRARIMLFYFMNDIFDPGGRGRRSELILGQRRRAHLVIDRPQGFRTHWAGSTKEFAASFGSCIVAFAISGEPAAPTCRAAERFAAMQPAPPANEARVPTTPALSGSSAGKQ
jgi:pimeloyl-ACP methyl ester carboxylesterase